MDSTHTGTGMFEGGTLRRLALREVRQRSIENARTQARKAWQAIRRRPRAVVMAALAVGVAAPSATPVLQRVMQQVELHSFVAPLAPAPHPPTPPAFLFSKLPLRLPKLSMHPLAGIASWYGSMWNGRKTASGETFDDRQMTAAHKTLPLGTLVRVTNLRSMRSVIVRINDRGAFAPSRIIDLSSAAARELGMVENGLAKVRLEVLGKS